jgi:hypothetical protein
MLSAVLVQVIERSKYMNCTACDPRKWILLTAVILSPGWNCVEDLWVPELAFIMQLCTRKQTFPWSRYRLSALHRAQFEGLYMSATRELNVALPPFIYKISVLYFSLWSSPAQLQVMQFWVPLATNCQALMCFTNVSYVVSHKLGNIFFISVYHACYMGCENIWMWMSEVEFKEFWRWCIIPRITQFMDFVHHPES